MRVSGGLKGKKKKTQIRELTGISIGIDSRPLKVHRDFQTCSQLNSHTGKYQHFKVSKENAVAIMGDVRSSKPGNSS